MYPYYHFDRFFIGQIIKCLKLFVRRMLIKSFLVKYTNQVNKDLLCGSTTYV